MELCCFAPDAHRRRIIQAVHLSASVFKRISDVYDEECAAILEEYGDEEALDFPENHRFAVPKGYHWTDVRSIAENVGVAIVNAFRAIERANVEKLQGVFGDGTWTNKNRLPDELLKDLIEHFSSLTLSIANCPEDELGQGYEYLIRKIRGRQRAHSTRVLHQPHSGAPDDRNTATAVR